ncbi:MAG: hypothetical protein WEH44_04140, partial [Pirellulaceae bacterium]
MPGSDKGRSDWDGGYRWKLLLLSATIYPSRGPSWRLRLQSVSRQGLLMNRHFRCLCVALFFTMPAAAGAQDFKPNPLNEPLDNPGVIPVGADGKPLNLNFENGTLHGWKVEGKAWEKQPAKGEISQTRQFGEGKKAEMTGQFWIGGYEFVQDGPQ